MLHGKAGYFEFTKEQYETIVPKVQEYFLKECEIELGNMQVRLFLRFLTAEVGIYYYNEGVEDSIAALTQRVEDLYALLQ